MDKEARGAALREGALAFGLSLGERQVETLVWLWEELLRWNERVNLTAITEPHEVLEKHFLDSLAVAPEVRGAGTLLDVGAGAGFPGLPLAVVDEGLQVTLVDAVAKKVGFMKHALAGMKLAPRARALHARLTGDPSREKLPPFDAAICRALMGLEEWLELALPYVKPGGRVVAMLGKPPPHGALEALQGRHGLGEVRLRSYALPSGAERSVVVAAKAGGEPRTAAEA